MLNIMLLGAPGAGKGTQAARLAEILEIPHISTGDIFRANIKNETELGVLAESYISKGLLVPDEVTCRIVEDRLLDEDCNNGVILDGFPRTIAQAEMLDDFLAGIGRKLDIVINIEIDEQEIIRRLSQRRICPECKATYHMDYDPPLDGDTCRNCGAKVMIRKDDEPEVIEKRLKEYHDQTEPLIEYYTGKGILKNSESCNGKQKSLENTLKVLIMR